MNRISILLALLPLFLNAQVKSECERSKPFKSLQIYDGIIATLERGDEYHLCPGSGTKIEDLEITYSEGNLKIRKVTGHKYESTPRIRIIYNKLDQLELYGKADVDTRNLIKQDSIVIILKSGASLYADLDVKYLEASVIEGALFKANGYANKQKLNVTIKATFSGFSLEGKEAEVKATTGGTAKVNIENKLNAMATTGGQVRYKGTPKIEKKVNTGGKVLEDQE